MADSKRIFYRSKLVRKRVRNRTTLTCCQGLCANSVLRRNVIGPHTVNVLMNGLEPVGGSPFVCNIYDVTKVLVTGLGSSMVIVIIPITGRMFDNLLPFYRLQVGQSITFTVDASQAGEGTLELVVTTTKSSVKADVRARSRGLYDVTFIPQEAVPHFVNITFNDEDVPGSPFKCDIFETEGTEVVKRTSETRQVIAKGEGLKEVVLGTLAFFEIDTNGIDGQIDVKIVGKSPGRCSYFIFQIGVDVINMLNAF